MLFFLIRCFFLPVADGYRPARLGSGRGNVCANSTLIWQRQLDSFIFPSNETKTVSHSFLPPFYPEGLIVRRARSSEEPWRPKRRVDRNFVVLDASSSSTFFLKSPFYSCYLEYCSCNAAIIIVIVVVVVTVVVVVANVLL